MTVNATSSKLSKTFWSDKFHTLNFCLRYNRVAKCRDGVKIIRFVSAADKCKSNAKQ